MNVPLKLNLPTLDKAKIPHLGYLIDLISPQRCVGLRWGDLGLTQLGNFGFNGTSGTEVSKGP